MAYLVPVFVLSMGAFGPMTSKDDLPRLQGIDKNNAENEFALLAVAYAWSQSGPVPSYAADLLMVLVVCRCIHNITFLSKIPVIRPIFYLPGLIGTLFISIQIMMKK